MRTKFLLKNWSSLSAAAAVLLGSSNRTSAHKNVPDSDIMKLGDGDNTYEPLILKPPASKVISEDRFAGHRSHSSHASHASHRSHASHASHYSGSSGSSSSYAAPTVAPPSLSSTVVIPPSVYEVPTRIELASGTIIHGTRLTKSAAGITFKGLDNQTYKVPRNQLSARTITELALPPEQQAITTPTPDQSTEPSDTAALRKKNEELEKAVANLRTENTALKEQRPSPLTTPTASSQISAVAPVPQPKSVGVYRVVGVRKGDYLKVRSGPGSTYVVVAELSPNERGIVLGSKRVANGATIWQAISTDQYSGWVNADHIALDSGN